jgi:hypothetical protein
MVSNRAKDSDGTYKKSDPKSTPPMTMSADVNKSHVGPFPLSNAARYSAQVINSRLDEHASDMNAWAIRSYR